jgi:hypothetical protein
MIYRLVLYIDAQISPNSNFHAILIYQFSVKGNAEGAEEESGVSVRGCGCLDSDVESGYHFRRVHLLAVSNEAIGWKK